MMKQQAVTESGRLSEALLDVLIAEHEKRRLPRLRKLWDYYRNELRPGGVGRGYEPAQAMGLPTRLGGVDGEDRPKHERVIENDIAWRIHTLVDFMFGRPVVMQSRAADPERARLIERFLQSVFAANGGVGFFQDMALLGAVYGYTDVLVQVAEGLTIVGGQTDVAKQAERFVLEAVPAERAIAVLDPADYRKLQGYVLHYRQQTNEVGRLGFADRLRRRVLGHADQWGGRKTIDRTQAWTAESVCTYVGERSAFGGGRRLVSESANRLGRIPVVHIQNLAQPFFYEGLSEVEPLIPLQDELNTRLSDRANRVTMQCFKMYLGKGIEQFADRPIGPGQMWSTENMDASIEAFGGDGANPSEETHISELRDALDKTSGVTAVAAGMLRGKVGNLTSENALRVVMMGLLAKTEKKRVTYGAGIQRLCELVLEAADVYGVLANHPSERGVRLDWPNPLPVSESEQLKNAQMKVELGVPREQVMAELGYAGMSAV